VKVTRFEDLDVWKKAREIVNDIYKITNNKSFKKDWVLIDQMRRSAISIISNIAEGFNRRTEKEFIQFLNISKGSIGELRCQLYIALDQNYIQNEYFNILSDKLLECEKMCSGLIKHIKRRIST